MYEKFHFILTTLPWFAIFYGNECMLISPTMHKPWAFTWKHYILSTISDKIRDFLQLICQNINFPHGMIFFKCKIFFFFCTITFCWKSAKFLTNCQIWTFFMIDILSMRFIYLFYYYYYYCINTLVIRWKSAKFDTNCQNMNFSCD